MTNSFSCVDETVIEENILQNVLRLLKKEIPDNFKLLTQFFQFFILYANNGRARVSDRFVPDTRDPMFFFVSSANNYFVSTFQ